MILQVANSMPLAEKIGIILGVIAFIGFIAGVVYQFVTLADTVKQISEGLTKANERLDIKHQRLDEMEGKIIKIQDTQENISKELVNLIGGVNKNLEELKTIVQKMYEESIRHEKCVFYGRDATESFDIIKNFSK
jgi:predicted PurR-regulated permease PerM